MPPIASADSSASAAQAPLPVSPFIAPASQGGDALGFNDLDAPTRVRVLSALCHHRIDRCVFTQRHTRRIVEDDQRCGQVRVCVPLCALPTIASLTPAVARPRSLYFSSLSPPSLSLSVYLLRSVCRSAADARL